MEFVVFSIVAIGVLTLAIRPWFVTNQRWAEKAFELGLHFEGSLSGKRRLSGTLDGCSVEVETFSRDEDTYTRISVRRGNRVPDGIQLKHEKTLDLKKLPSVSETIDWARVLVLLQAPELGHEVVKDTLNVLLKYEADIEATMPQVSTFIAKASRQNVFG